MHQVNNNWSEKNNTLNFSYCSKKIIKTMSEVQYIAGLFFFPDQWIDLSVASEFKILFLQCSAVTYFKINRKEDAKNMFFTLGIS